MPDDALNDAVLACRVPPFEEHEDLVAMPDEVALQLDEFDPELVEFAPVVGAGVPLLPGAQGGFPAAPTGLP